MYGTKTDDFWPAAAHKVGAEPQPGRLSMLQHQRHSQTN